MDRIEGFNGEFRFLSNFSPCRVVLSGVTYPTVEHAYQAAKSLDVQERIIIEKALGPGQAKKLGSLINIRPDWEDVKEAIMRDLLIQKFAQPMYMELLLATGEAYIEETNSWRDTYWGVYNGRGLNRLGYLLMEIRTYLKEIS
ncbi:NADAR family protein [Acinetobacter sp.]|uniref:NADAR family protein n=1 Tax=Acinetobacter sp. TaxID=472 RepID=UPI00388E9A47